MTDVDKGKQLLRVPVMLGVVLAFFGCGIDKAFVMDTKLDAPLRQRLTELHNKEMVEVVDILGKCATAIDRHMRQSLISAGSEVTSTTDNIFTARVSSSDILDVAAVEFVTQLQLSQPAKPLSK